MCDRPHWADHCTLDVILLLVSILSATLSSSWVTAQGVAEHSALGGQSLICSWKWLTTGWNLTKTHLESQPEGFLF